MTKPFYEPPGPDATVVYAPDQVWDQALICLNGHILNDRYRGDTTKNAKYCAQCGAETRVACAKCGSPIPGFFYEYRRTARYSPATGRPLLAAPLFCETCASAFPWTTRRVTAAKEYIDEFSKLSAEERATLTAELDELLRDTPRGTVAAMKVKTLLAKAGGETFKAVRDIMVDIVSKAARDQVFGPGSQ